MRTLEERVAHLERSLARSRALVISLGVLLASTFVFGATRQGTVHDLLRAKTLHIEDDNGNVAAVFTSSADCGKLYLKHVKDSTPFLQLDASLLNDKSYGGHVRIGETGTGKTSVELAVTGDKNGQITVKNNFDRKSAQIVELEDGGRFEIFSGDIQSKSLIRLEAITEVVPNTQPQQTERRSRIETRSDLGNVVVRMDSEDQSGSVDTFGSDGVRSDHMPK